MEAVYTLDGVNKTLNVYDNKVVLTEKKVRGLFFWLVVIALTFSTLVGGLIFYVVWNMNNGKEKTIYLKNVKSVEVQKPSSLIAGYIQFNLDDSSNYGGDRTSENSVAFVGKNEYDTCVAIRDFIEEKAA